VGLETPPADDEVEVSIFGPGFGEGLAVHLGRNDWMLVDSCIDRDSREPASLRYLRLIGVDPDKVVAIVATHWHDDHVRGLARIVETCPEAHFFFSAILKDADFRMFVAAGGRSLITSAGTSEFAKVLELFEGRAQRSGARPLLALPDRVLWEREDASIRALSPSDEAIHEYLGRISAALPSRHEIKRRISDIRPNDTSVVLWISVGEASMLLGGDLERRAHPRKAWNAILASHVRPNKRAQLYKVPHHGSATASEPRIWDEMLTSDPVALLTPFARSDLPKVSDVADICARTRRAYISASPRPGTIRQRPPAVMKSIEGAVRYLREAEPATGHIRARRSTRTGDWSIELFPPARELCQPEPT